MSNKRFEIKEDHFPAYKEVLKKCIDSCVQPVQLEVCYDLMERFKFLFKSMIDPNEINSAMEELLNIYVQKHHELAN